MKLGKFSIGIAAVALAAAPSLAQVAFVPALAPLSGEESELSETGAIIFAVVGVAAIVGGIIALSGDDDEPLSP